MKTINATMEMLSWCRLKDVLRWVTSHKKGEFDTYSVDFIEVNCGSITNIMRDGYITIPADHFTASVIARAALYLDEPWHHAEFNAKKRVLVFSRVSSDKTMWSMLGCGAGAIGKYSREWVEAKLNEMET